VAEGEAVVAGVVGAGAGAGGDLHLVSGCRAPYFVPLPASEVLVDISLGFHKNGRGGL
jgi:hypothetical protein